MRLSLMPSLRYSTSGSPPVFSKGRTATESMACALRERIWPSTARRAAIDRARTAVPHAHARDRPRVETAGASGSGEAGRGASERTGGVAAEPGTTAIGPTNR